MENCKYCGEALNEKDSVCPACGKDNAAQEISAEPVPAEEIPAEEIPGAEVPAEEAPAEETAPAAPENKDAMRNKVVLMIIAIAVVAALIVGLLAGGGSQPAVQGTPETTGAVSETVPTIPADGNPDDQTCKGTYTVSDEEAAANMDTIVATVGDHTLTNGQLQVLYWMQVQSFLSSEYGSYMMYYGALDYTQPLDVQTCVLEEQGTWQQFFLKEALTTWQNYCALADKAQENGMELSEADREYLNTVEESLNTTAASMGLADAGELLKYNVGAGAAMKDYVYFQELLIKGNLYYDAEQEKLTATDEELEAFYAEHEAEYAESGITRDGKYVDVRHVLLIPKGGTVDETGATVYSEEEWLECQTRAETTLNEWLAGDMSEESFAELANAVSEDPGSNTVGGLYEDVYEGQMVPEFEAWCFDETREYGNTGIVKTSYGYHLMYYVGSTPIWQHYAKQDILTEKSNKMMEQLVAAYPLTVDYSKITLGYVNLAS